jgi:hypothetical protein
MLSYDLTTAGRYHKVDMRLFGRNRKKTDRKCKEIFQKDDIMMSDGNNGK